MDSRAAYASLVKGINSLDFSGDAFPCELLLTGDTALPVLVATNGQVLIAASQYGKGRMVVFSHEECLKNPKFSQFIKNAIGWLKPSPEALVGVKNNLDSLAKMMLLGGTKVLLGAGLSSAVGVYCTDAYDESQAEELVQFVKEGGGLLIGGQAWHWASQHGLEKVLSGFPGNRVTSVAGVYFTGNVGEQKVFSVSKEIPRIPLITLCWVRKKDLEALLKGVSEFNLEDSGVPSSLLVHGSLAFPVGLDEFYEAFIAAAHYGRGRVVVASHELQFQAPSMKTFFLNAIQWLDVGKGGKVGVGVDLQEFCDVLHQERVPCELTKLKHELSVYCCTAYSDAEAEKIHEFVSEGGGLLIGGQAWSWSAENPSHNAIAEYPGNKILQQFGIGILERDCNPAKYPAGLAKNVASTYHFRKALFQFREHMKKKEVPKPPYSSWIKKLGQDSAVFIKIPAENAPSISSVHNDLFELIQVNGIPTVNAENPIKSNSEEAVLLSLATEFYNSFPEFQKLALPLSQNLPETPASHPVTIRINGRNEGKREVFSTLLFPSTVMKVQIGCHSDDISNAEELKRAPVVIRRFDVTASRMEVSNLWGGLLYVIVPEKSTLGQISVTVEGAVQAPFFKLGKWTPPKENKKTIRHYPGPWAELATENIILTVPADDVRNIEHPETLLAIWEQMMKAVAKLAAIPAVFPRPERIVADVQISVGWMHSGYPIMLHLESVAEMIGMKSIQANGLWGPIHELGHNQQRSGWDFPPHTTEATCNLWSVYVNETVLSIPRERAHEELAVELRAARIQDYIKNGAKLKDWEFFTALETYLQLQEAFGWEPFIHIFAEYQRMTTVPEDNESKMNLWAEKFSEQVKKDLAPFFKAWGWPMKEELSQKLARAFPKWAENPMQKYLSP
uniref:Peptidase M60 domain-containing protein n=1 Tax=Sphenodon punctatus TaxID=8508 RepID=A0A8D0HJK8_SPHPU